MTVPFILASSSPRRRDLLQMAGYAPQIVPAHVDESPVDGESPDTYVARLAAAKAGTSARPGAVTLGSDTTVVCGGTVYGKPGTPKRAAAMLRALAGKNHQVLSGVAVTDPDGGTALNVVTTQVEFTDLPEQVITAYAATAEPLDKAGSYGIQGYGATFVRAIHGSYSNVVGLPLAETISMLTAAGLPRPIPIAEGLVR